MMKFLFASFPKHALSLDVSTDNTKAVRFYRKMGLKIQSLYLSEPDKVEFALFETPIGKDMRKLDLEDPQFETKSVQRYFNTVEEWKLVHSGNPLIEPKDSSTLADSSKAERA
jgi:RimJ/RimL family protein N-acetyltransferase